MTPIRATGAYDWAALLDLIRDAFAYMDARIDPPSSMHRLTAEALADLARTGEIWVIEDAARPVACVVLSHMADALYLGKLSVAPGFRGRGVARVLVETAASRAKAHGHPRLRLQVRVELIENQRAFAAMGFVETGRSAHPGFERPTSITMERAV